MSVIGAGNAQTLESSDNVFGSKTSSRNIGFIENVQLLALKLATSLLYT